MEIKAAEEATPFYSILPLKRHARCGRRRIRRSAERFQNDNALVCRGERERLCHVPYVCAYCMQYKIYHIQIRRQIKVFVTYESKKRARRPAARPVSYVDRNMVRSGAAGLPALRRRALRRSLSVCGRERQEERGGVAAARTKQVTDGESTAAKSPGRAL